jgi:hypothetical protein
MQALRIRTQPCSMPRPIAPARPEPFAAGAALVAQSMLWMLRRRARRHDGRKFTA